MLWIKLIGRIFTSLVIAAAYAFGWHCANKNVFGENFTGAWYATHLISFVIAFVFFTCWCWGGV